MRRVAPQLLLDKVTFICTIDRMDRRLCTVCTGYCLLPVHCLYRLLSVACVLFVPVTVCCLCTVCTGYCQLPVRLTAIGLQGSNKKCWLNLVLGYRSAWVQTWGESRRTTRQERKSTAASFFQILPWPIAIPFGPNSSTAVLREGSSSAVQLLAFALAQSIKAGRSAKTRDTIYV
jgi:hypothetical protein